jgi:hypothetical protein
MEIVLWILQIILCIKFISVGISHWLRKDQELMKQAIQTMGNRASPVHSIIGILCVLGALGVLLPSILGRVLWMVPAAAAVIGIAMLISIPLHIKYREKPLLIPDLILFILSLIALFGRWPYWQA